MLESLLNSTSGRCILPEAIWLEPEHFYQATEISNRVMNEDKKWQNYLNALGLFGFEQWLSMRMPTQAIPREIHIIETCSQLKVGEFKFCLISSEHLLDEVVSIPEAVIAPGLASHFYVVLEVSEEQEEVIIRGCLRYDQLVTYCRQDYLQDNCYQLPLTIFDPEPNHLLHYYLYLDPSSISLPVTSTENVAQKLVEDFYNTRTNLSRWLEGIFDEGWQVIDTLINPETSLAFSTRHVQSGAKRAKLIDLGVQLGSQTVALLVNITEESEEKLGILIQLHPTGGERFLPENIKLSLFSKAGKILQEVSSRTQDNFIQLKPFKGEPGKRFSIELSLDNAKVRENFEL
ncbi:hypothetical protein NUACC21_71000 [Scytonema sp. NUACC21]